jgi:hypothetical protein
LCGVNPDVGTDKTTSKMNFNQLMPCNSPKASDSGMHCGDSLKSHKEKQRLWIYIGQFYAIYEKSTFDCSREFCGELKRPRKYRNNGAEIH